MAPKNGYKYPQNLFWRPKYIKPAQPAVQTSDFMTAAWAALPNALLEKVSSRIIDEVRGINRVTYTVSSKLPVAIEWE